MWANLSLAILSAMVAFVASGYPLLAVAFSGLAIWQGYCAVSLRKPSIAPILRLAGFTWDIFSFCRGWLIVGETGSGKTQSAINTMLWQVSKNCPSWGGVCIDDKGVYWETLSEMFRHLDREQDLILIKVRPEGAPSDWQPPHTFNFLDNPHLPWSAKAKNVCDVAASLGQDGDQPFFKVQAEIQMEFAFRALKCAGFAVTLEKAYELLSDPELLEDMVSLFGERSEDEEAQALLEHYRSHIASQPAEQLGGVRGTLANRLKHFTAADIARVFCAEQSSFSFDEIDRGKVICVSIPQRFQTERRYIHTLLKLTFYSHVLLRFDRPAAERANDNLLILWADEAQKIVTANDDGASDYNVVDVIREAKATVVAATQSYTSLIPPIGSEEKTKVFIANMANRITFKAADEDTARMAADALGKHVVKKRAYTYSGGKRTVSVSDEEKHHIPPHELRTLRPFEAVVQHCRGGFCRGLLPPHGADGRVPDWYR